MSILSLHLMLGLHSERKGDTLTTRLAHAGDALGY